MRCETIRQRIVDGLIDGPGGDADGIASHLSSCAACRAERLVLVRMWDTLGFVHGTEDDGTSERMRGRFDALLDAFDGGGRDNRGSRWRAYAAHAAAAVAVLSFGFVAGRHTAAPTPSAEMATMRQELQDLRHMITLSLMQQQSATDRLKGVSWSGHLDDPGDDIVQALLDTLMHDPNVNVRLASIDALHRFAERDTVRRAAMEAMHTQASPLVQIALIDFVVQANERGAIGVLRQLAVNPQSHEAVRARASWAIQILG